MWKTVLVYSWRSGSLQVSRESATAIREMTAAADEVPGRSQLAGGGGDQQRGHERGGAAEEGVGEVEADREAAVADPGGEHFGQEARAACRR